MKLYLISHAHTEPHRGQDVRSWVLSARGQAEVRSLAELPFWSEVDLIVLSTEAKTALTALPQIEARGCTPLRDERFDELHRGGWVADYSGRVRAAFASPDEAIADWEPANHALGRFIEGVDALLKAHPERTIALVSHGLVLSLFRAHLLGQTHVDFADWQQLSFAAVAVVDTKTMVLQEDFSPALDAIPRGSVDDIHQVDGRA